LARVRERIFKRRIRVGLWVLVLCMLSGTVYLSVAAAEKAGAKGMSPLAAKMPGGEESGHILVDVSASGEEELVSSAGPTADLSLEGIGPLQAESPFTLKEEVLLEEVKPGSESPLSVESATKDGAEPDPEALSGDEEVRLEEESPSWNRHVVAAGDTLSGISGKYQIDAALIVKANALKHPDRLSVGQELLVPKSPEDVNAVLEELERRKLEAEEKRRQAEPVAFTDYAVKQGDSLWSIASAFGLDINTLFGCNDLKDPDVLKPGTSMRIPNQDGVLYKIKKGDSLKKIAERYGVHPEAVLAANGLGKDAALQEGQSVFLPGAKPITVVREGGSGASIAGSGGRVTARGFAWPVRGRVSSPFGWRRDPFTKRRDFHTGIDVRAPRGQTIVASKNGTVVFAGWMGGYGRVVVLNHGGGYTTIYAHCNSLLVKKGQSVSQGKAIARVGASGRATGTHLHFEVRVNNSPINPMRVLR
jgi:murein DD-endopeptidase MepM/ murein hydrolase activator NlpD